MSEKFVIEQEYIPNNDRVYVNTLIACCNLITNVPIIGEKTGNSLFNSIHNYLDTKAKYTIEKLESDTVRKFTFLTQSASELISYNSGAPARLSELSMIIKLYKHFQESDSTLSPYTHKGANTEKSKLFARYILMSQNLAPAYLYPDIKILEDNNFDTEILETLLNKSEIKSEATIDSESETINNFLDVDEDTYEISDEAVSEVFINKLSNTGDTEIIQRMFWIAHKYGFEQKEDKYGTTELFVAGVNFENLRNIFRNPLHEVSEKFEQFVIDIMTKNNLSELPSFEHHDGSIFENGELVEDFNIV